ncbi:SDR family oxidoreductase [Nocardia jiangxiensis]|uniref:SDR family oxidoreductase n=1 Tax=Nocardia jiangxiensis TaxID=282685 RepID=A0ABW6S7X0_9NOCA|nr:SDR family oxidoreductase [Nocardia jiangxiensis]
MRIFVTGGSGLTGPAIVSELIAAGHTVTGLARSDASAQRLEGLGATAHPGSLDDLDSLRAGAAQADAVVHMAFGGDFSDTDAMMRRDCAAIRALGEPLEGSGKPLISTSGTLVLPRGRVTTETDAPDRDSTAGFRIRGEDACLEFAERGVRASVLRLAPTVHGPNDYGFIPMLIAAARKTGVSAYIGDGSNRWPAVHRLDAAVLYRLAVEHAPAGAVLHGTGQEAIVFRDIAETIADALGIPTRSLTPEEAVPHFENPFMASVYAADAPVSSEYTRKLLDWEPTHPGLLEDLEHGDYFTGTHS